MRTSPYGRFPSRRPAIQNCDCEPGEPGTPEVPNGPHKRYWGACATIPETANEIKGLSNSDYKATVALVVDSNGVSQLTPYWVFACPTAYGTVDTLEIAGFKITGYGQTLITVDGVSYRLVWNPWPNHLTSSVSCK